jgi:uncharacterized protein YkwD
MSSSVSLGLSERTGLALLVGVALTAVGCTSSNDGSSTSANSTDRDSTLTSSADEIVAAHNAVRAEVTEPPGYQGTWQALPLVKWSDKVAASAQGWADHLRDTAHCGLEHDTKSGYGENLAAGTNLTPTAAVAMWAGEKSQYTYNPHYEFVAGHYTQIVWRSSTEIGCGAASCDGQTVIVCRYSPPGNVIGQAPY